MGRLLASILVNINAVMRHVRDIINMSYIRLKNLWAAHGPGNSNHLEIIVIHETNASKFSSAPKDSSLMK